MSRRVESVGDAGRDRDAPVEDLKERTAELETALDALTYEIADLNHRIKALASEDRDETEGVSRRREVGVGLDDRRSDDDDRGRRADDAEGDGIYVA